MNSVIGKAIMVVVAVMFALPMPVEANDWDLDKYTLTLYPTARTPIRLYDMNSRFLGELSDETYIPLQVTGEMVRRSMVNGSPDMRRVLQHAAYQDANGNWAVVLRINRPIVSREGNQIPGGIEVIVALNDFLSISPAQASASTQLQRQPSPSVSSRMTEVAPLDEPTSMPEYDALDSVVEFDEDDDEEEFNETRVERLDVEINRLRGRPFPATFLSAPTCDCGSACSFGSDYGPRRRVRTRNGRLSSGFHKGIDIRAPMSTPVIATADGCVSRRPGVVGGYGKTIFIGHGNGYETQYSHLTRFASGIREGACFSRGDVIGYVGQTGNSTGPHLHFSVLKDNNRINPMPLFIQSARSNSALRQRCDSLLAHPQTDQAMRNALGLGGNATVRDVRSAISSSSR